MSTKVTMPQLGESVVEGTIARWLKKPGDHVDKYEPLVEVMTDKVTVEVPSTVAGNLLEIFVPEGQTVAVGTEIAAIEEAPMPVAAGSGDGTHVAAARAA
ncbi:MAG: 2-oxo acid dehydrogenase subunit E2, partial [Chloroflexota bacterium]